MATDPQNVWNTIHPRRPDMDSILLTKQQPPDYSWWITEDREQFTERWLKELPRITGSDMSRSVPMKLLGGKLP